jgi:Flp pilus assembly protein TadG
MGRSRRVRRGRADRGASAIELAILAPALLILTMIIIQFALWFQARQAALAAAQEGARIAREDTAAKGGCQNTQAVADTMKYYQGLGTRVLSNPSAQCATAPGVGNVPVVGVTMHGRAMGLLSMFGGIPITVTVEGPEECFHPLASGGACNP